MSRKLRRLQKKRAKKKGNATDCAALTQQIISACEAGRFQEAFDGCQQFLTHEPDNENILNLAGGLSLRLENYQAALKIFEKAVSLNPSKAEIHFNLGCAKEKLGFYDGAIDAYERSIALSARPEFYFNMGNSLLALGRTHEAMDSFHQVIAVDSKFSMAFQNLGFAQQLLGHFEDAEDSYQKALQANPANSQVHNNLGNVLKALSKYDQALTSFQKAISLDSHYGEAYFNMGLAQLDAGDFTPALESLRQGTRLVPDNDSFWRGFAVCLGQTADGKNADQQLLSDLNHCLAREGVDPYPLCEIVIKSAQNTPEIKALLAKTGLPSADQLLITAETLLQSPLSTFMTLDFVAAPDLEHLLTTTRHGLLAARMGNEAIFNHDTIIALLQVLAQQCFLNEYVYAETAQETEWLATLQTELASSCDHDASVALYACYRPLDQAPFSPKGPRINSIVIQQKTNAERERKIITAIKPLTPIEDGVSNTVRGQYEDNPYPRWQRVDTPTPSPLAAVMGNLFPGVASKRTDWPTAPKILIAGCGTGKQAVDAALRFANSDVIAFDLSLASLAHGQRRAEEMGISNLHFMHGDILKLRDHKDRYDLVLCTGVLHHMENPVDGWRILLSLLNHRGLMKIGLYSRLARHGVTKARAFVKNKGYDTTLAGIRAFRQAVMDLPQGNPVRNILQANDFFSTSECRDLAFHVQESQFDLAQIQEAIKNLNLSFLGFEMMDRRISRAYRQHFPKDKGATSLENWHMFEKDNPTAFAAMYQFWVEKQDY